MIEIVHAGTLLSSVLAWVAAWLVTWFVHSTLLLGLVWLSSRRLRSPRVRERLWQVAIVASVITATMGLAGARGFATSRAVEPRTEEPTFARASTHEPSGVSLPTTPILVLWFAAAFVAGIRLELGRRRYWRAVGRRETLADGDVVQRLRTLQQLAGCDRTLYLTTSERIGGPVAIGTAEICLPATALAALTPSQRDSVLAHELGHVVRRDPLSRFAVELLTAAFAVQPLLRIARRELRDCAEMLCDDFAVTVTGQQRPLVESLALLASGISLENTAAMAFGEHGSPLTRRVQRILEAPIETPQRRTAPAIAVGALFVLATAAVAGPVARPASTAPAWKSIRMISVEQRADTSAAGAVGVTSTRREVVLRRTPDGPAVHEYRENGVITEPDASAQAWLRVVLRQHGGEE